MVQDLDELLNFDPLQHVENVTGVSYRDPKNRAIGLVAHMEHCERKRESLRRVDDTAYSTEMEDHLRISRELGFEVVYEEEFTSKRWGKAEKFYVLWHPDGMLMTCETFESTHRNSAKIYYNIRFKEGFDRNATSSGHYSSYEERLWVGDHDAREALRHSVAKLRANGELLPQWIESPRVWMHTYDDESICGDVWLNRGKWNQVSHERHMKLPGWLLEKIAYAKEVDRG